MDHKAVLNDPNNQKYLLWTGAGLKLAPDAPEDVAKAWQTVIGTDVPQRKARLNLLRRARGLFHLFLS